MRKIETYAAKTLFIISLASYDMKHCRVGQCQNHKMGVISLKNGPIFNPKPPLESHNPEICEFFMHANCLWPKSANFSCREHFMFYINPWRLQITNLSSVSYQKKIDRAPLANPSFGMKMTKILTNVFWRHTPYERLTRFLLSSPMGNIFRRCTRKK